MCRALLRSLSSCCACGCCCFPWGKQLHTFWFTFERQVPSVDFEIFSTLHSCLIKSVGTVLDIFNNFQKQFWGVSMYLTSVYRILTCKCVYICLCIYMYTYFQIFISIHHLKQDTVICHFCVARIEKLPSSSSFCVCRKCALLQLFLAESWLCTTQGELCCCSCSCWAPVQQLGSVQCFGGTSASRHCPVPPEVHWELFVCLPRPAHVLHGHLPAIPLWSINCLVFQWKCSKLGKTFGLFSDAKILKPKKF